MNRKVASLCIVGDLVPSRESIARYGENEGTRAFAKLLADADIAFGDLEIPLTEEGFPREKLITFRASPKLAQHLGGLGFDVVSLANNHSLDYGPEGLAETMRHLEKAGIAYIGGGKDLAAAEKPTILNANGLKIGLIAWSCLLPVGAAASSSRPGIAGIHVASSYDVDPYMVMEEPGNPPIVRTCADEADVRRAVDAVRRLRSLVDFVVVSVHWGFGAGEELAEYQQPLGHALIDAGADLVAGNHVHAVHAVESYGHGVIFYSPGNCIAQQPRSGLSERAVRLLDSMSSDSYATRIEIENDRRFDINIVPTSVDDDGRPIVLEGIEKRRVGAKVAELSARLGTTLADAGGELRLEVSLGAR